MFGIPIPGWLIKYGGGLLALLAAIGGIFLAGKRSQKKTDDLRLAEAERRAAEKRAQMQRDASNIHREVGGLSASDVKKELSKWKRPS